MKIQYLEGAMGTFTMHMQIANQILEMIWTFVLLFKLLAIQINHTQNEFKILQQHIYSLVQLKVKTIMR